MKNIFIILGLFVLASCGKGDLVKADYNHNGNHHDDNRGDDYDRHRDRPNRDDGNRNSYWPW